MPSQLHQLNNESILLLYLADELSAEDRTGVDQLLASDPKLREQLDALRQAYDGARDSLATADQTERLAMPAATAARRVGNAVRSWHARRLRIPPQEAARRGLRFPWWWYVTASAAGLVIIAVSLVKILSDRVPNFLPAVPNYAQDTPPEPSDLDEIADPEFDEALVMFDDIDAALDEAEAELYALSEPADDGSGIMPLFGEPPHDQ